MKINVEKHLVRLALDGVDGVIAQSAGGGEHQLPVHAAEQDAQKAGGEAGVVEVISLVHAGHVSGQRGEHEADEKAHAHAHGDADARGPGIARAKHHLGDGRGQSAGEQAHIDHASERHLFYFGIQEGPEQNGKDVQRVFPVEAETQHQEKRAEGRAADLGAAEFQHRPGDQPHQAHAEQAARSVRPP